MDQIRNSVERIAELSDDELSELRESILSEYQSVKDSEPTREIVEQMQELAQAAQAVQQDSARRETEAAELAAAVEEAGSSIAALETPEVEESEEEEAVSQAATSSDDNDDLEEDLAEDEEIDPVTGKKRKKRENPETETEASVADNSESVEEEITPEEVVEESNSETEEAQAPEPIAEAEAGVITADAESKDDKDSEESEESKETPETNEDVEEESTEEVAPVEESETPAEEEATENTAEIDSEEETVDKTNEDLVVEVPEAHRPQPKVEKAPVTITAGADLPGITAGTNLPDFRAVSQAIIDRRKGMGRTSGGDGEQMLVASVSTDYPDSRVLNTNDLDSNDEKIRAVVSTEAITAAGGLLGPVETRFDLFGLEENLARPVKDSLAVFQADRGGIRFLTSPSLEDLTGAASVWTIEDDEAAAGNDGSTTDKTKPCLRIKASTTDEVFVDAIPLCLTFGNMGARFFPELVERNTKLGMMWHARFAEQRLVTRIGELSTNVTSEGELGAARDFLVAVETAAAGYRNRHRMNDTATLRVILPSWFKNALRADLTKQIPGADADDNINLSEARMNAWFSTRGINVTWAFDGESSQYFGNQAGGSLVNFPENVIWYLFAEGTFLFLDAGVLDLGLVRDSTLNSTNDYKMFLESFEGVVKVGVESLRVTTPVNLYGATAATYDTIGAGDIVDETPEG